MSDQLHTDIGKLVTQARIKAQLTQAELAAKIGLSRTSVANLEAGNQGNIAVSTIWRIAAALQIEPECLLPIKNTLIPERPVRGVYVRVVKPKNWRERLLFRLLRVKDVKHE